MRRTLHPGRIIARYLIGEFVGLLIPILVAFVFLYLVVDFFERLDIMLKYDASLFAAVRYFVFKIPLIVTQILPPSVLTALLISIGNLGRNNEIVALRASGISMTQSALPLLGVSAGLSVAGLVWNETVVPYSTSMFQHVNNVEIRKRAPKSLLSDREIWFHGGRGFYRIEHMDPARQSLFGLTIYQTDTGMSLRSIIEADSASWTPNGWELSGAIERLDQEGTHARRAVTNPRTLLPEVFADFLEVHREPEEMSYLELRERIYQLTSKGIDASNYRADLELKLAVPFTSLVLACVAIPLAGRVQRHPSVAAILGTGILFGFGYWVLLALGNSLGQSGTLPAIVAAWTANAVFTLVGAMLFLHYD